MNLAKYKKECWEKRFERLIIKSLFSAWEAGKKQVKTPYKYLLDTDKLGRPIFDMAIKQITHALESERKHAYQKGYTKGRVETAKAMMALNELEKKVKQL